jgi:hypothetical protein
LIVAPGLDRKLRDSIGRPLRFHRIVRAHRNPDDSPQS